MPNPNKDGHKRVSLKDVPPASPVPTLDEILATSTEMGDIESLDKAEDSPLAGLKDTGVQRVQNGMIEWNRYDDQRSQLAYRLRIAKLCGDREEQKIHAGALDKTRKRLVLVLKDLVRAMAEETEVRNNVANWTFIRLNLRPHLKKHLALQGIDVSVIIARAEEIDAEEARMRAMADAAEET